MVQLPGDFDPAVFLDVDAAIAPAVGSGITAFVHAHDPEFGRREPQRVDRLSPVPIDGVFDRGTYRDTKKRSRA